ncbi:MAG: energy-coupled thiamine transporter ThiT [Thaumarchaeota archaeon]|nr:energy-coupled thiamine transporter ThiT [Nitrososphaerota archaeon]
MTGVRPPQSNVRVLAEAIMMIALAGTLQLIKIFSLPQGGSVTLGSMIPILLFALRRGPKAGLMAGAIYGIVALYPTPFIYHPIQFLLDYPVAFGALGLAGFIQKQPLIGVALGIFGRFVAHFLSGIIFFASFAPEGISPVTYSAIYNGSYLGVELVISAAVMFLLVKRRALKTYL